MKQKKNRFFTLIFSMMFGAGQMYMGFMKQGLSIMGCAIGVIAMSLITQLNILNLLLPLIWFYGFFDAINKSVLTDEAFAKLEDSSIIPFEINTQRIKDITDKYQIYIGGGFIFIGICILNNSVLSYILPRESILLRLIGPQFLISVLIIAIGVQMIRGKKQEFLSLWGLSKRIGEKPLHSQEEIKVSEAQVNIEKGTAFDHNFFKEVAREENKVSMAMFQPEGSPNSSLELPQDIETVK